MSYQPTKLDMAADLRRCIYASLSKEGFEDENVKDFLRHALVIYKKIKTNLDKQSLQIINERFQKAQDQNLDPQKRREDLLTASLLL